MAKQKKITKLTAEQEPALIEHRERWYKIGTSTEPADFVRGDAVIRDFYRRLGKPEPLILHFSSPAMCELAVNVVFKILEKGKGAPSQLENQLGNQLWNQLRNQLENQLGNQLGNQLWNQLRNQLENQLGNQLGNQLWNQLENQLGNQLGNQLWNQLGNQLWNQLGNQLRNQLGNQLWNQLWNQLGNQLRNLQPYCLRNAWASHWQCAWLAYFTFAAEIGVTYPTDSDAVLRGWTELAKSVLWWAPWDGICFVSDRPREINFDDRRRLHSETGMAIRFSDGWGLHAVHGVRVPAWIIEEPTRITPKAITEERNAEIKRVMIARYPGGLAAYMRDAGGEVLDQSRWGTLYSMDLRDGSDQIVVVAVKNSTPEPDGSIKDYTLTVHHECRPMKLGKEGRVEYGPAQKRTALNAIASTFGMTGEQYAPLHET
ncbi:MAG: DUF6745 domain-containing protein [Bradyrhizobium sp.]|uniref:DUF6745 domain-containing protein n=1 Tax=Bradyrhizobium sp. TaxID=376 RepID=UPI003D128CCB